jgi:hypothetical protein
VLLEPVLPLAPIPLVPPLPAVPESALSAGLPGVPLEPIALVSPGVPAVPADPTLLVGPGAVLAVLSAAPVPLTDEEGEPAPMPLLDPVPDVPGVMVDGAVFGVLPADLSSPQPEIANASATLAAIVSSLVIFESPEGEDGLQVDVVFHTLA